MQNNLSLSQINNIFFIGIAGVGMSALAQFLAGTQKNISGSDRYFTHDTENETRQKLELEGIKCFPQNGEGITENIELIIVSTAVEDTVPEVKKGKELGIPIAKQFIT